MLPRTHIIASCVAGVISWAYFKSFGCAVASLAAGVLIDIDHVFDYLLNRGVTFNVGKIYRAFERMEFGRIYVLLHSYELLILFWAAIFVFSLGNIWKAAAFGVTLHIALDQIGNPIFPLSYFLFYRISKRFDSRHIMVHNKKDKSF